MDDGLTNAVRAKRARPVRFELPGRRMVSIPPPTLAQAAACVQLDPVPGQPESAADQVVRSERQARILLGKEHEDLVAELQPFQVAEVIGALYVAASGLSPVDFARWQRAQRKSAVVVTALKLLETIEDLIIDLAARLGKTPVEAGGIPLADAVALRERMAALEKQRFDLQAIIAGTKLTWTN